MENATSCRPRHLVGLLLLGLWGIPALAAPGIEIPADLESAIGQSLSAYDIRQKLTAQTNEGGSDAQKSAAFGFRIALSADGNTALVAAAGAEVAGLPLAGAAYVYTRTSTGWTIQQRLTAQNGDGSDDAQKDALFGGSVALSGDGQTALIGAYSVPLSGQPDVGAAYVYRRNGSLWQIQQKITAQKADGTSDASKDANFGSAVALSADGHTAAIGARQALGEGALNHSYTGAVYVYRSTDTGWQIRQKLMAQNTDGTSDATPGAQFGDAVALAPDGTLLAGADHAQLEAGAAYVYTATDAGWAIQQKLTAQTTRGKDDSEPGARFGGGLAISNDGGTALISAFQASVSGLQHAGTAYVYQRKGTRWTIQQKLIAQTRNGKRDAAADAWFGACALTADGDTALIGAPYADADGLAHAGAAYLYRREGKRWSIQQKLTAQTESGASDAEANAHFGKTVLSANGGTAFIGAYDATVSGLANAGAVYAYDSAYRLTVTANGGTVTSLPVGIDCGAICEAGFAKGTAVTLTAVPAEGYHFKGWSGGGCSGKKPCTVKLNRSKTVTAKFVQAGG